MMVVPIISESCSYGLNCKGAAFVRRRFSVGIRVGASKGCSSIRESSGLQNRRLWVRFPPLLTGTVGQMVRRRVATSQRLGSIPRRCLKIDRIQSGVAQLVECLAVNQEVVGSSPTPRVWDQNVT